MKRWPLAVLAVAALALGLLVWLGTRDAPGTVAVVKRAPGAPATAALPPEPPAIAPPVDAAIEEEHARPIEEPHVAHLFDPCLAPVEPSVPTDDESITVRGITVAWSTDISPEWPFHPAVLAATVRGILDEAAEVTGTQPREKLTVIVYPTQAAYLERTHGPDWSGGLYDGSAIRMPASGVADVGVDMRTLRHELMHAQLHVTIGCMPAWFNEGIAMYFGGDAPMHDLVELFRDAGPVEPSVNAATYEALDHAHASRAYADSLARIMYVAGRPDGEQALRDLTQAIRAASQRGRAAVSRVWDTVFPRVDQHAVLDALARKVFDAPLGSDVDALVRGPMCCTGTRNLRNLSCRATPPGARPAWIDKTTRAVCRNLW